VGKLQRYFWPKSLLLFYLRDETIEAAFGYLEKDGPDLVERRRFGPGEKGRFEAWYRELAEIYPQTYVGTFLETVKQGAFPGCGPRAWQMFGIESALNNVVCIDGKWSAYVSSVEMKWFEQRFKAMTFDYLFSPFVLLYTSIRRHETWRRQCCCAVLHRKGLAFLVIVSPDEGFCYAQALALGSGDAVLDGTLATDETEEELAFDLDMLDEEDVEPIEDVDVFGEFKEESGESAESEAGDENALEMLEYNLNFFEAIKEAIERFYKDDRYPRAFVERVVLYDLEETGDDFVRYVEDELFMEGAVVHADPLQIMAELVAEEGA